MGINPEGVLLTGVMPMHKAVGKMNYNFIVTNERKHEPLMRHFQYLLELGKVRATRTVTTLVDGMAGRANRDDDADATFLPRYMGYRNCYKWYMMALLGYNVRSLASGLIVIESREDREPEDPCENVSFATYYYEWKTHFPQLKVNKAVEDICQYCYAFAR